MRASITLQARLWLALLLLALAVPATAAGSLPSWNDGAARQRIVDFVTKVTDPASASFVPPAERIATFDQDGTLWVEQPVYPQVRFILEKVPGAVTTRAELERLAATALSGMPLETFRADVRQWLATARHPRWQRPYTELTYQPMQELLRFLRANGYKTYIVSGGGIEFMRPWTEAVYGIPPEQVVGSSIKTKFEMRDGVPVLMRLPELNFIDDKEGKPVAIQQHIGRRPIMAFGNSDGDFQMLEWTTAGKGPRLALIVHHDDAQREYAYDKGSHIGKLEKGLDEAPQRGWSIISMKNDWKNIYP
jgi:phosphoserine phosphatase